MTGFYMMGNIGRKCVNHEVSKNFWHVFIDLERIKGDHGAT